LGGPRLFKKQGLKKDKFQNVKNGFSYSREGYQKKGEGVINLRSVVSHTLKKEGRNLKKPEQVQCTGAKKKGGWGGQHPVLFAQERKMVSGRD